MLDFIGGIFWRNMPVKLIALALAFLVWYYIGQEITDRVELTLEFSVLLPSDKEWEIYGRETWDVHVTLRGPHSDIQRIRALAMTLTGTQKLNLEALRSDRDEVVHHVPVTAENFHLPFSDIRFISIDPDIVDVRLLRMDRKTVRVLPVVEGDAAKGFARSGDGRASPPWVQVRGPRLVLKDLEEIRTYPVLVGGRAETFEEPARIQTRVDGFDLECKEDVTVQVRIREKPAEIILHRIPVFTAFPPNFPQETYRVKHVKDHLDVRVRGPQSLLDRLDREKASIFAKVKNEEWSTFGASGNQNATLSIDWGGAIAEAEEAQLDVDFGEPRNRELLSTITRID